MIKNMTQKYKWRNLYASFFVHILFTSSFLVYILFTQSGKERIKTSKSVAEPFFPNSLL